MTIPVIDLLPARRGTPAERLAVAREINAACTEIGFFIVRGHGVPAALVADTQAAGRAFFDQPREEREKVRRAPPAFNRGWGPVGEEALGRSLGFGAATDVKESFAIGTPDLPDTPYYTGPQAFPHFVPNRWPDQPPELRPLCTAYFEALQSLSADIMRLFALALDLPAQWFDDKIDRQCGSLRLISYPAQTEPPAPGQLRAGAHTDYGSLTIVCTEAVPGGLEARTRGGDWVEVAPKPDEFVVNIGDLMMMGTNDRWLSNLHRVGNPPGPGVRRLSLVFFHQPNYDAEIRCIESCRSADNPARYPGVTSGAHRLMKLNRANAA